MLSRMKYIYKDFDKIKHNRIKIHLGKSEYNKGNQFSSSLLPYTFSVFSSLSFLSDPYM